MNARRATGLVLLALGWAAATECAASPGSRIFFGLAYAMPLDNTRVESATFDLDEEFGLHAGYEWRVRRPLGIAVGVTHTKHDVQLTQNEQIANFAFQLGDLRSLVVAASVNFHPSRSDLFDVYIGPTVGRVFWGDVELNQFGLSETVDTDDGLVYGLQGGIDFPRPGKHWTFTVEAAWLVAEVEPSDAGAPLPELAVDPLQLKLGLSFAF